MKVYIVVNQNIDGLEIISLHQHKSQAEETAAQFNAIPCQPDEWTVIEEDLHLEF